MEPIGEFISTKEAADLTGYTRQYVANLVKGGKVQGKLIGARWLVLRQSILNYRKENPPKESPPDVSGSK